MLRVAALVGIAVRSVGTGGQTTRSPTECTVSGSSRRTLSLFASVCLQPCVGEDLRCLFVHRKVIVCFGSSALLQCSCATFGAINNQSRSLHRLRTCCSNWIQSHHFPSTRIILSVSLPTPRHDCHPHRRVVCRVILVGHFAVVTTTRRSAN